MLKDLNGWEIEWIEDIDIQKEKEMEPQMEPKGV